MSAKGLSPKLVEYRANRTFFYKNEIRTTHLVCRQHTVRLLKTILERLLDISDF